MDSFFLLLDNKNNLMHFKIIFFKKKKHTKHTSKTQVSKPSSKWKKPAPIKD
jgi:hypothetical protein